MSPSCAEDWIAVARERANDANAMRSTRKGSAGPVYMAGYAIECSLKAYLLYERIRFPRSGREGHNLKALWRQTGFKLRDIHDDTGEKTFFVTRWSTDLRYETAPELGFETDALVIAAAGLSKWLQNRLRASRGRL